MAENIFHYTKEPCSYLPEKFKMVNGAMDDDIMQEYIDRINRYCDIKIEPDNIVIIGAENESASTAEDELKTLFGPLRPMHCEADCYTDDANTDLDIMQYLD